ncbi:hypothetical protein F443_01697 [Phytophthora nicotianae P1569]|uniref:Uncharacterized protein n=1 Tax=Phytophthora nicotianae P1569 TaxID=1317065 RepID=V9FVV4_PHYNI|nr:hypothetical protein F443_01697 [Phytophthora nicotianae P1569]
MQSALLSFGLTLLHSWQRLQVTYYGGKYSIQRALALEAYTTSASVSRVLFVCVGSLLPMLSLVFALELIPLQDPKEGWRSNYGFWIRSSVMVYVGAHALTVQATYLIDGINISVCRQILLSIGASVGAAACSMAVASQFGFPVPFFVLTMTPVFCGAHLVAFRAVVGSRMFRQILAQRDQLIDYSNFVSPQFMVAFIYPAYEALFRFAEGSRLQLAVILMLPFLKMIVKYIMLRCTKHMEDMTPEANEQELLTKMWAQLCFPYLYLGYSR